MQGKQYQLLKTLGEGGFGQVYQAVDPSTGHHVAVKILKSPWDGPARSRFIREVEEIRKLRSKRIVKILDFNLSAQQPFYVMPYFKNQTLRHKFFHLQNEGKVIAASDALQGLLAIIEGLEIAHNAGIFHRDLKPENILIDDTEEFVISDFGIGDFVHRNSMVLTLCGPMGTPEYCAPEQWETGKGSTAADIFSLGIILYEMLVGTRPLRLAFSQIVPSKVVENIPADIDNLFRSMVAPANERIQTCRDLRSEIVRILKTTYSIQNPGPIPWGKIGIGAIGLGLVAAFLWAMFGGDKGKS